MRFKNNTSWNTSQLRALCKLVIRNYGSKPRNHNITINYKRRQCSYHGCASLGGSFIEMNVPHISRKVLSTDEQGNFIRKDNGEYCYHEQAIIFDAVRFAQVLEHEIGHNLGLSHDIMPRVSDLDCGYAKDFKVEVKEIKHKSTEDRISERASKAIEMLNYHLSRVKREENLVRKWKRKVDYYKKKTGIGDGK